MSDSKIIRNKLRKLLPTLDLEKATQRSIQEQLEEELGVSLEDYKAILKAEVDSFLLGIDPDEETPEQKSTYSEPPSKKPRQEFAAAAASAAGPSTTPASGTGAVTAGPGDFLFSAPLSRMRFAGIRTYKNRGMVDIREFYDKDGIMAPGAKGLAMSPEQWHALTSGMVSLNEALSQNNESFFIDLGANKRASISSLGGKIMISLREHYEKDGKMLPGKKGISLPPDQWMKLCAVHEELTEKLSTQPNSSPTKAAKAKPAAATGAAAAGAGTSAAGGSELPLSERKGNADATLSIVLAPMRRAEVTRFKGKLVVDIREFYEKDGALAHTKKGLQLDPTQFQVLKDGAAELNAALQAQNVEFELVLAPKYV